jgi:hypothetical protein
MADPTQQLLTTLTTALEQVVQALENRGMEESSAIADVVQALKAREGTDLAPVVAALRQLRIQAPPVTVNAPPPDLSALAGAMAEVASELRLLRERPVPQAGPPVGWTLRLPGAYGTPDRVLTLTPSTLKEKLQ